MEDEFIAAKLLLVLADKRKWGESHTAYENMVNHVRSDSTLSNKGMKCIGKIAGKLVTQGFVIEKRTGYGLQVSLNPRLSQEIKAIIRSVLGKDV